MVQIEETDDEITLKGFPLIVWAMAVGAFVLGFSFLSFAVSEVGGIASIGRIIKGDGRYLVVVGVAAACFVGGLCLFHFLPMTVTSFNRATKTVKQTRYTLIGKRTRRFGYSFLQSKVQCESDTAEGTTHHWLFFYVEGGERIYVTGHSLWSRDESLETADKLNKYLTEKA
ncbi:MAG: hypothetical protein IPN69_16105 [Acidobacteria bacterium]|nr:hypothetical protein [Acidobacteriota bacterium]MBK8812233.1 hypothetical protein [Acidobacteriota bacterium]